MREAMRGFQGIAVAFTLLVAAPVGAQRRLVEATFDEGADGSAGEIINSESAARGGVPLRFVGGAHRSAINEGRYGRAAVFAGGGDAIEVNAPGPLSPTLVFFGWVQLTDTSSGWILHSPESLGVRLRAGELEVAVYSAAMGDYQTLRSGVILPTDGSFHHLLVYFDLASAEMILRLDFGTEVAVSLLAAPPYPSGLLLVGEGLQGMIDELMLIDGGPSVNDLFDVDPNDCAGLTCLEEQFIMTPDDWSRPEPVRFKTGVDGGVPDAGGGLDAGEIGDAGVPGSDAGPPGGDEGGCSCRLAPGSSGRGIGSLLLAFGLLRFTRRQRP